jgi:hypothetical protein
MPLVAQLFLCYYITVAAVGITFENPNWKWFRKIPSYPVACNSCPNKIKQKLTLIMVRLNLRMKEEQKIKLELMVNLVWVHKINKLHHQVVEKEQVEDFIIGDDLVYHCSSKQIY